MLSTLQLQAGAMRDACYVDQRCLALLMSADATGAMLEPGPMVLGCDGQVDLAARGKASIQWDLGWQAANTQGGRQEGAGKV